MPLIIQKGALIYYDVLIVHCYILLMYYDLLRIIIFCLSIGFNVYKLLHKSHWQLDNIVSIGVR
jgi:hypothetical protein